MVAFSGCSSVEVEQANEDAVVMVASLAEADPVRSWSVAAASVYADFSTCCTVARHSRTTSCVFRLPSKATKSIAAARQSPWLLLLVVGIK